MSGLRGPASVIIRFRGCGSRVLFAALRPRSDVLFIVRRGVFLAPILLGNDQQATIGPWAETFGRHPWVVLQRGMNDPPIGGAERVHRHRFPLPFGFFSYATPCLQAICAGARDNFRYRRRRGPLAALALAGDASD